jgi:predicted nucleic acid-binding Zn ribbon protein
MEEKRYCLNCGKEIVAKDKRQKFCCQSCAASYNNKKRAKKKLSDNAKRLLNSKLNELSKEALEKLILEDGLSFFYIAKMFRCCPKTVKRRAEKFKINYERRQVRHYEPIDEFQNTCANCGKPIKKRQIFCSHECCNEYRKQEKYKYYIEHQNEFTGKEIRYDWLKPHILKEQNNCCAICGSEPIHNGKELHFILDHIDGDATNNTRSNLRLVCPNCDSQLDTFKSRNIGKSTRRYKPYRK